MSDLRVSLILQLKNLFGRGLSQVKSDLKGLKDEAKGLGSIKGPNASGLTQYGQRAREASTALRQLKRDQAMLGGGQAAGGAAGHVLLAGMGRAGMAVGGAAGVAFAGKRALDEAVNFEYAMAQVKKKVEGAEEPAVYRQIERDVKRMAQAYGIAQVEMAKLVAEAGASGVAVKDLSSFMNLAAKASVGWDMTAQEAAQTLAQIKAGSQMSGAEVGDLADMINYLGDSSAAKERDIVEMFQRSSEAARAAGSDTKTTLAFLTGARAMGIGTEIGGRFFGAFTSKLTNVSKKGTEALKGLGLSAEEVKKGMEAAPFETMIKVLDKLKASARRAEFAKDLFGAEWFDEALRLAGGIKEVKKAYDGLQNAGNWRGSLNKGLNIELATTRKNLDRLKAVAADVGDSFSRWSLGPINSALQKLFDLLDKIQGRTKTTADKENAQAEMKRVAEYETGAREKDEQAATLRADAKTTKDKKDKATLETRAKMLEKEAAELRGRANEARETGRGYARTAQSGEHEAQKKTEQGALKERLGKIQSEMTEGGEFKSPEQKKEHDAAATRLKELRKEQEATAERERAAVRERQARERFESGREQRQAGLQRLQGVLGGAKPGQDFVRDPQTGVNWNVDVLKREIDKLKSSLGEVSGEAGKAGAEIKDKLTMDLTGEGARAGQSFATGLQSAVPAVQAAASAISAAARPNIPMSPAAPAGGGAAPAGGGGGGAKTTVIKTGAINVHGSGDPEATARAVSRRLASAVREGLGGAHHDGVT